MRGGQYRKAGRLCQPARLSWVDRALAAFIPWRCHLCGDRGFGLDLCPACLDDLPWLPAHPPLLPSGALAALAYEFPVDRLIAALKFRRRESVGRLLGDLLTIAVREAWQDFQLDLPDMLVPVPLHPRREWQRGYNQAETIAATLGQSLGVPVAPWGLRRVRHTPAQSGLGSQARRTNLRGAFRASPRVAGTRIALVDDVMTTGSTIAAARRALRVAGAVRVEAWVVSYSQAQAVQSKV